MEVLGMSVGGGDREGGREVGMLGMSIGGGDWDRGRGKWKCLG